MIENASGDILNAEAGFTQGPYGPYAENHRHVLAEIEGHFISGYAHGGGVRQTDRACSWRD